jgi:hypothetical protein
LIVSVNDWPPPVTLQRPATVPVTLTVAGGLLGRRQLGYGEQNCRQRQIFSCALLPPQVAGLMVTVRRSA